MNRRKGLLYVCILLLALGVQFVFSSQPYGQQDMRGQLKKYIDLNGIQEKVGNISFQYVNKEISFENNGVEGVLEFLIRKAGHFFGFMFIGIMLFQAIRYLSSPAYSLPWSLFLSLFLGVLDEWHQSFTPDRSSLVTDVVLDFSGASIGIIFLFVYTIFKKKQKSLKML